MVRFCALIHCFYPFFSCSLDLSKLLLSLCAGVFAVLMGSRGTDFRSQSFFNATLTALTLRAESTISSSNAAMQGQGGQLMTNNLSPEVVALTTNTAQAGLSAWQANVMPPAPNSSFATGAVWSVPLPSTEPILESVLSVPSTPTSSVIPSLFFLCCSFVYFDLYAPCVIHPVVTVDFGSFFS